MSCRSRVLCPLPKTMQVSKTSPEKEKEAKNVLDVLRHAPEEVGVLAPAEQLHKLLVVRDDDQLEIPLLAPRGDDAAK